MQFFRIVLCFILCFTVFFKGYAEVMIVPSGTVMVDKFITGICKDQRGLMWIGTRQGLYTYDGYDFVLSGERTMNEAVISTMLYDQENDAVWVGTSKGLYNVGCSKKRAILIGSPLQVISVLQYRKSCICASYKNGEIALFDERQNVALIRSVSRFKNDPFFINSIQKWGTDTLALLMSHGQTPYFLSLKSKNAVLQPAPALKFETFVHVFGDTLLTEGVGLELRDRKTGNLFTPIIANYKIRNITSVYFDYDKHTTYVFCRPAEIYKVDMHTQQTVLLSSGLFSGRLFLCSYFDEHHILWIGTNKGLIKITPEITLFDQQLMQSPPISVRSLAEDDRGNKYAGTYRGLFRFDSARNNWAKLNDHIPYSLINIPGKYVYSVGEEKKFFRINKRTGDMETGFYKEDGIWDNAPRLSYAIAAGANGLLWIGTNRGLLKYDTATCTLSPYRFDYQLHENINIRYIKYSGNGKLWLCTQDGFYELSPDSGVTLHLRTNTQPALAANIVNFVDQDKQGRLWLCTDGGGINIVSHDRKTVKVLKAEEGLSNNTTYNLLWQDDAHIWVSTFNGLSSYNLSTGTFYNYYTLDGISNNEFNHNAFLKDRAGNMYFGTINGLNVFNPDSLNGKISAKAGLFISTAKYWDNSTRSEKEISLAGGATPVILQPFDHSLVVHLALTDYTNPESNIFWYRIQGLFDEWITMNNDHILRINGLAAGKYMLEIKALDSHGMPAANIVKFPLELKQAFYSSWWFYLLLFIVASSPFFYFFYQRLRYLQKMQYLREQIASDLHDEVGSLLTRITMTSENLRYFRNTPEEHASKLDKIAGLGRTAISSMSDVLWAIDARNDYAGSLADRMREHAEEMLLPLHIDLQMNIKAVQKMSVSTVERQDVYLILKEAINNIVKHSKATIVHISYDHNETALKLIVSNNKSILKEKNSLQGQGLRNIQMRAQRLSAKAIFSVDEDWFIVTISKK